MKRKAWRLLPLAGLFLVAGAWAAGNMVQIDYTDTVAPAEQQAYEAGVKAFNQCLSQHDVTYRYTAWYHVTGDTYQYSYVSEPLSWADFDTMHQQFMPCISVWQKQVNPHLVGESATFNILMPGMSNIPNNAVPDSGLVYVIAFKLQPGYKAQQTYNNDVKMLYSAMEKTKWPGQSVTLEVDGGGPGSPDSILVIPFKNFKAWGMPINPPFWKMIAKVYGQKKADQIRDSLSSVIKHSSSHYDAYSSDLSYIPSGQ